MAYSVNGKVYTSHPLMDEIVYNCKLILNDIVIKNDILANNLEYDTDFTIVELFKMIKDGSVNFDYFTFSAEILRAYGYSQSLINLYLKDKYYIPEEERDNLLDFSIKYFTDHFEEKNNYYRMLMGLPPYGTDEYDIILSREDFPANYTKEIDFSKPIHEMDVELISILQTSGRLEEIINSNKGFNYSYLRFLGDKKIDWYTARKATKYDILYMPSVERLVSDRFKELYISNRDIYLKRTYSEAYAYGSDYYDECMIIMILAQTFNDMIVDVPEWYIRRDIFDLRSVQYFLDSNGVDFFKEIPLKYQIRIVKNLNKLIKYKSSNKNFDDILEIFSLENTSIFKYYLYKKRLNTTKEQYDLEFVQVKINESYDDYIRDLVRRYPYDTLTKEDKYWDGENSHEYVKNKHMERDFTIEGTKYMSVEYKISFKEYMLQMEFLLGLILDSNVNIDDIKVNVSSINSEIKFRLTDLFILLNLLSFGYENLSDDIIRPNNDDSGKKEKPEFTKYDDFNGGYSYTKEKDYEPIYSANGGTSIGEKGYLSADGGSSVEYSEIRSVEDFYDWMKYKFPELFVTEKNKVYGYNTQVDVNKIKDIISRRHSQYQFDKGFDLSYFKVDKFIIPQKISTIDELVTVYNNNKECYNELIKVMLENIDNRDTYKVANYIFDQYFTKEFDYNYYKKSDGTEADSLEDILYDRDFILYNFYLKLMGESNIDSRKDNIRSIINDIINTLEYYISGEGLDYLFAFTTVNSFYSLTRYIYLLINFFKSYKVYFLDPFVTYSVDNKMDNFGGAFDAIAERKINNWKYDKDFVRDNMDRDIEYTLIDRPREEQTMEALDLYNHFEPDPEDDYDYDGMYADTNLKYKDANGGYADPKQCIPYIMLNGGKAHEGRINLWDLDGAGALEMTDEYLDVDGGYPIHIEDRRKDYWTSAFSFIIDGGTAGTKEWISKSIHVKVIDRQIQSDVRISSLDNNKLTINEDGLYIGELWISNEKFKELVNEADSFSESSMAIAEIINYILKLSTDEERINEEISNTIESMLHDIREVTTIIEDNTIETKVRNKVDSDINNLYSEFVNFNPLVWESF